MPDWKPIMTFARVVQRHGVGRADADELVSDTYR